MLRLRQHAERAQDLSTLTGAQALKIIDFAGKLSSCLHLVGEADFGRGTRSENHVRDGILVGKELGPVSRCLT